MAVKSPRIFFGWWIVGASVVVGLYVTGTIGYGFTAVFEPIADETGWSYAQISFAASLRGLVAGLLAPLIGVLVDRWGPRRLMFGGGTFIAVGFILLARITSLSMFYGASALIALGMSCCGMTAYLTAIAHWFRRKVGIANGIASCGYSFGGLLVPIMVKLIDMYDWRMTLTILGLGTLVVVLPLSLLFRHKPEQYGYLPDGQTKVPEASNGSASMPQPVEADIKPRQALKSSAFWHISLALMCYMLVLAATITHVMPYLSSIGVPRSTSSLVATAVPLVSIAGRLGLSWLGDRRERRLVVAGAFTMMCLGLLCFGLASRAGTWLLVPFIILFGAGYGGCSALRPSLVRDYFGRNNFGTVFGFVIGVNMLGTIVGPPLAGWAYDHWGSYQSIWLIFAALPVAAVISILTLSPIATKSSPAKRT